MTKEAFVDGVRKYEAVLYRISLSILHNESYCLDAVQEAICKAFANLNSLRNEDLFKTWLVRILINECYKIRNEQKKIVASQIYEKQVEQNERYNDLYEAIEGLKPKLRIVIVLYYIEGFSVSEIATILKIPEGTVKSRLAKGRKELKKSLLEGEGCLA